ncbi:MAG: uncharacterized protein K0Q57_188 [Gammaproteobacteria bacterium]|nr:uncharacterized protein [Gammaproteobacteria bacterium]
MQKFTPSQPQGWSGVGVGLRSQHYAHIMQHLPPVPWFEVLTDNYLDVDSPPLHKLDKIRQHYPMVMHGVGLSIGGTDLLDFEYLKRVESLIHRLDPVWVSDHFCWTSFKGCHSHELLPLPFTHEAIKHIVSRIHQVQDYLKRPILLENISSYCRFECSEMTEAEFINAITLQSGCGILLDINNIYVNSQNHGFNPADYLQAISPQAVKQFHLAGYEQSGPFLVDNHGAAVYPQVWQLYKLAIKRFGPLPTCIEWDNHVPAWEVLMAETYKAEVIMQSLQAKEAVCY